MSEETSRGAQRVLVWVLTGAGVLYIAVCAVLLWWMVRMQAMDYAGMGPEDPAATDAQHARQIMLLVASMLAGLAIWVTLLVLAVRYGRPDRLELSQTRK
jgi:uncharacterized iron-regulated membrane protein